VNGVRKRQAEPIWNSSANRPAKRRRNMGLMPDRLASYDKNKRQVVRRLICRILQGVKRGACVPHFQIYSGYVYALLSAKLGFMDICLYCIIPV
jgi:hypothetical protein